MMNFIATFSEGERINAFLNPNLNMLSDEFVNNHKDQVLKALASTGVAYTTEISRIIDLHIESVNKIMNKLIKEGLVERFIPDRWHPQPPIRQRLAQLQSSGMDSYSMIRKAGWWVITPKGVYYLKTNFPVEDKIQVHGSVISYYHPELRLEGSERLG